jgi:hypothetical protein
LATAASNAAPRWAGISVKIRLGAVRGATWATWASRLDWMRTTAVTRATPRPIAGVAVRAAERGPARLARARRRGPRAAPRAHAAALAPATPSNDRIAKAAATAPIITAAARGVGALAMARATRARAAIRAATTSTPRVGEAARSRRSRTEGGVARARASGINEKAAADSRPKAAALMSGQG